MSERIKRYMMIAESHTCSDGTPGAKVREEEHPIGAWCRSTDVAALEAENARLRRIVEAERPILDRIRNAGNVREGGAGGQTIDQNLARQERRGVFSIPENMFREWEAALAYDAAKAQATQQGEKKT